MNSLLTPYPQRIVWLNVVMYCLMIVAPEIAESKAKKPTATQTSGLDTIRGLIKPAVSATISSDIQARIIHLPFKDGQRFKKGQALVKFDCKKYHAELNAARTEYEARKMTLENNLEMASLNSIGQLEVDMAKVDVKKSITAINIATINTQHCTIHAPFSGRVIKMLVHQYESVNPYDELFSILDDSRFEVELILPSSSISWLKKGMTFQFTVDETGQTHSGTVTDLGASIDPVSQTIRVSGKFKHKPKSMLSGMSGSALFSNKPKAVTLEKIDSTNAHSKRKQTQHNTRKRLSTIKQ